MAAVTAAGAAARDILLAAERKTAIPAVAGFDQDFYFVDEQLGLLRGRSVGYVGVDVDVLAHAAAVAEFDHAGDFGEQGVVLAAADVHAGLHFGAALTHDDGTAGDKLTAEGLYAQPLRIGVAPVFRTA